LARRSNSPWSKTYKEGLPTTAVNDHVNIDQNVNATITTGVIDSLTGLWKGVTVTDDFFALDAVHEAVPNTGTVLSPQSGGIDMTGFNDLFIAIKSTEAGAIAITAVMGTNPFANLSDLATGQDLRGTTSLVPKSIDDILKDASEVMIADVWNIFSIKNAVNQQKSLQFKLTNNSGSEADVQFAYLRVV